MEADYSSLSFRLIIPKDIDAAGSTDGNDYFDTTTITLSTSNTSDDIPTSASSDARDIHLERISGKEYYISVTQRDVMGFCTIAAANDEYWQLIVTGLNTENIVRVDLETFDCSDTSVDLSNEITLYRPPLAALTFPGNKPYDFPVYVQKQRSFGLDHDLFDFNTGIGTLTYNWEMDGSDVISTSANPTETRSFNDLLDHELELQVTENLAIVSTYSLPASRYSNFDNTGIDKLRIIPKESTDYLELVYPENGATVYTTEVDFRWKELTDPGAGNITYNLYCSEDSTFAGTEPVQALFFAIPGIAMAGLIGMFSIRRNRHKKWIILIILLAILLISVIMCSDADGGGGQDDNQNDETTQTVSGLNPDTTYYWKVVADKENGGTTESEVWSFHTD